MSTRINENIFQFRRPYTDSYTFFQLWMQIGMLMDSAQCNILLMFHCLVQWWFIIIVVHAGIIIIIADFFFTPHPAHASFRPEYSSSYPIVSSLHPFVLQFFLLLLFVLYSFLFPFFISIFFILFLISFSFSLSLVCFLASTSSSSHKSNLRSRLSGSLWKRVLKLDSAWNLYYSSENHLRDIELHRWYDVWKIAGLWKGVIIVGQMCRNSVKCAWNPEVFLKVFLYIHFFIKSHSFSICKLHYWHYF